MTAIHLLDHHTGTHRPAKAARPSIFRRVLRIAWRKPAAPEGAPFDSGAAAAPRHAAALPAVPLSSEMSDAELAALDSRVDTLLPRPVNGRNLGDLPRRKPIKNRQPWQTAQMPAVPTQAEVHAQYMAARERHPVYGEACVAEVQAAELARRAIA